MEGEPDGAVTVSAFSVRDTFGDLCANVYNQDYEIGLACLGSCEGATGAGVLRAVILKKKITNF